ncbi:hypothetical protein OA46_10030 [Enterobacter cloacae]|nr:hypothetical protein OA46_10030 [Enterobacter cloacae]
MIIEGIKWIAENPEKSIPLVLSVVTLAFGGIWTALTFIHKAILESKDRELEAYQKVIEVLNEGKMGGPYIDYQLDSIYQLRFFPRYYQRSLRLIDRLIPRWEKLPAYQNMEITEELQSTRTYIARRQSPLTRLIIGTIGLIWPWL